MRSRATRFAGWKSCTEGSKRFEPKGCQGEVDDGDIKFFDAALDLTQKRYKTDPNRVYILGHSNGGLELARRLLNTDQSKARINGFERSEPGVNGTELVTYFHSGGHEFPGEALPSVIKFFQRHVRK